MELGNAIVVLNRMITSISHKQMTSLEYERRKFEGIHTNVLCLLVFVKQINLICSAIASMAIVIMVALQGKTGKSAERCVIKLSLFGAASR